MKWFDRFKKKYIISKYKIGDKVIYDPFKLVCKENFNGYVVKIIDIDQEGLYTIECSDESIIHKIPGRALEDYMIN